ncbi:MAG: DsbA family protein [Haloferacaceae archaeon]
MDDDRTDTGGDGSSRRAFVGGIGAAVVGGGVVYGASRLQGDGTPLPFGGSGAPADMYATDRRIDVPVGDRRTVEMDLADNPLMGASDADVVVYYWSDYQCPFCRRFEDETLPKVIENYVAPGTLRIVFLQFPYIGDASTTAARASKCVWRQVRDSNPDAFWNWHTTVFENQGDERSGWASRENLLEFAGEADGVDADAVGSCLDEDGQWPARAVQDDFGAGRQFGLKGTPGFVFRNPQTEVLGRMMGAQPYDRFAGAIEKMKQSS